MKYFYIIIFSLVFLVSCSKQKMYKYAYQLSGANKETLIYEKLPFICTNFVTEKQADLTQLNQQTLINWNKPEAEKIYKIDTAWLEPKSIW